MIETLAVPLRQKEASARSASIFSWKTAHFSSGNFFSKRVFAAFAKVFQNKRIFFYVLMSDMGVKQESNKRSMNFFRK